MVMQNTQNMVQMKSRAIQCCFNQLVGKPTLGTSTPAMCLANSVDSTSPANFAMKLWHPSLLDMSGSLACPSARLAQPCQCSGQGCGRRCRRGKCPARISHKNLSFLEWQGELYVSWPSLGSSSTAIMVGSTGKVILSSLSDSAVRNRHPKHEQK